MLRVIVESATNIPKTKFGKPDPIVSVIFKGKATFSSRSEALFLKARHLDLVLLKSAVGGGWSVSLFPWRFQVYLGRSGSDHCWGHLTCSRALRLSERPDISVNSLWGTSICHALEFRYEGLCWFKVCVQGWGCIFKTFSPCEKWVTEEEEERFINC